jgi:hypothetical protein
MKSFQPYGTAYFPVVLTSVAFLLHLVISAPLMAAPLNINTFTVGSKKVKFDVVKVDPSKFEVQVKPIYSLLNNFYQVTPNYTLKEAVGVVRPKPAAAINGGYSRNFDLPLPAGLVIVDSKVLYRLDQSSPSQNGVFCAGKDIRILWRDQGISGCQQAVQAGPVLVHSSKPAVLPRVMNNVNDFYNGAQNRSVICIDSQDRLLLMTTGPVDLPTLSKYLASDSRLACRFALNLGGSTDASLYVTNPNFTSGMPTTPIASAIFLMPR